jgi:hypothetical protein
VPTLADLAGDHDRSIPRQFAASLAQNRERDID